MYDELLKRLGIENKNLQEYEIPQYIRINTLKIEEEKLISRLKKKGIVLEKVPFLSYGYSLKKAPFSLASTEEYLLGYFYIQEAASQFPLEVISSLWKKMDVLRDHLIFLDMSAAPGSKTTQAAQYMENKGTIVALDILPQRLDALKNNLERMGVKNTIIYNKNGLFVSDLGYNFDFVLLDAPCSGNYTLRDYCTRSDDEISQKSAMQKRLIKSASLNIKKDGYLLYSTCSLEEKENEKVVEWATKRCGFSLVDINSIFEDKNCFGINDGTLKGTKRFFPHLNNTQGFFLSLLKKN